MKKYIILVLFSLISFFSSAQIVDSAQCVSPIGTATEGTCIMWPLNPPITNGQIVTRCFTYDPNYLVAHLSYIILNSTCGPFAPYNNLTYNLYNSTCDSLLMSGSIYPTPINADIGVLDTVGTTYVLCYTWNALCDQFAVCPVINGSPLPITLVMFQGEHKNRENYLTWTTASEINNNYFAIQRSSDGISFSTIDVVTGAGNSTSNINYTYIDRTPLTGNNYYRLKQVDYDGTSSYSQTIVILNQKKTKDLMSVKLYDVMGTHIETFDIKDCENISEIMPMLKVNKIYFIKCEFTDGTIEHKKLIRF